MKPAAGKEIVAIVGATGVGKTAYAVSLAKQIGAEIISADSRQIYRGMDIGTGKETRLGHWQPYDNQPALVIDTVPIHGLDLVDPGHPFSVADWVAWATAKIDTISKRQHIPLIVGGTGYYLQGLTGAISTLHIAPDPSRRQNLAKLSVPQLQEQLRQIDQPKWDALNHSDQQNPVRLIRAIEVAHSGTKAEHTAPAFIINMLGLFLSQAKLYTKVDARIDDMVEQGLIEETSQLLVKYGQSGQAMTGIGYAEIAEYLQGQCSLEQAIQRVKYRTHAYIRRQNTWWKKQSVTWVDTGQVNWPQTANAHIQRWLENVAAPIEKTLAN